MQRWPHQIYGVEQTWGLIKARVNNVCLTAPTGAGKSRMMCDLIHRATACGMPVSLYTHRKMLLEQVSRTLTGEGIEHGIRAAGHKVDMRHHVQLSSIQTEVSRVLRSKKWSIHNALLVLVDECHLQASGGHSTIFQMHQESGATVVGLTATPLDIGHFYNNLVVAGKNSELRACGAHVPVVTYGPDEPDTRNLKRQASGEYTDNDIRKVIMTPVIFGRVYEWWRKLNPEAKPTILFGPGVGESLWFAQQFDDKGVRAAHIDGGTVWVDGATYDSDNKVRDQVVSEFRSGELPILCNRFVLREGIDIPEAQHLILATIFGGLKSYLQAGGRILRACKGVTQKTVQDHGGNWWRHGDLNQDREWDLVATNNMVSSIRESALRESKEPEPIVCPKCRGYRLSGPECPHCGYRYGGRSRIVIQRDGSLKEMTNKIFTPRRVLLRSDTERIWTSCMHRCRKTKRTFNQAEGLFFYENHYYPPRNLPGMPIDPIDWFLKVGDVPKSKQIQAPPPQEYKPSVFTPWYSGDDIPF